MNISFLMLAAILLIGFTISKMNERHILQEKIRYGERMIQDFQTIIDFISRDKKKFTLDEYNILLNNVINKNMVLLNNISGENKEKKVKKQ